MSIRNELLEKILDAITDGGSDVAIAYADLRAATPVTLTATPTLMTNYTDSITPQKISHNAGVITSALDGVAEISVERAYSNGDRNPSGDVVATIDVRKNGITYFTRSAPIPPAVRPGGDGIVSFTSLSIAEVSVGDTFEVYVSASDDGGEPSDATLTLLEVVINNIHNKPV